MFIVCREQAEGLTAVHLACVKGHANTVKALIAANVDITILSVGEEHPSICNGHIGYLRSFVLRNLSS